MLTSCRRAQERITSRHMDDEPPSKLCRLKHLTVSIHFLCPNAEATREQNRETVYVCLEIASQKIPIWTPNKRVWFPSYPLPCAEGQGQMEGFSTVFAITRDAVFWTSNNDLGTQV